MIFILDLFGSDDPTMRQDANNRGAKTFFSSVVKTFERFGKVDIDVKPYLALSGKYSRMPHNESQGQAPMAVDGVMSGETNLVLLVEEDPSTL